MVPWYSVFDILQYKIAGNDVKLLGAVNNPTIKTDAENAVKQIEGVEKVDDQIEVLPPSPMDDQIRRAEYRAIYGQGNLSRYGWEPAGDPHHREGRARDAGGRSG